jgi:hypothetical protein
MAKYITESTQAALEHYKRLAVPGTKLSASEGKLLRTVTQEIYQAFVALTNGLMATNRFYIHCDDVENLKTSCIVHLFAKIPNYDPAMSAFSYFNMVARNFFICEQTKNRRRAIIMNHATAHRLTATEKQSIFGQFEEPRRSIPVDENNCLPVFLTGETDFKIDTTEAREERDTTSADLKLIISQYRAELQARLPRDPSQIGRNKNAIKCKVEILDNISKMLADSEHVATERRIDVINALTAMTTINFSKEVVMPAIRNVRKELVVRAKKAGVVVP